MITINKIMTEPYKHDGALRSNVSSGFATIQQKSKIVKLKLLSDATISVGDKSIKAVKGEYVILSEEVLYIAQWAKNILTFNEVPCIIIDPSFIIGFTKA